MQSKFTFSALIIFLTFTLFSLLSSTTNAADTIFSAKQEIESLIEAGDFSAANTAIEQMKISFADEPNLPEYLCQIAYRYEKVEAFEQAELLNSQIAADFDGHEYGIYAALQFAKLQIYGLIDSGNYEQAEASVEQMAVDFAGNDYLARRLWEAANRYDKFKAFGYSKELCEQIVTNHPEHTYATYAALQLAKLTTYELIDAGDYESADVAISQIINNFTSHKQLSRRLYEIAKKYEQKGDIGHAKILIALIAANYPNDKYGIRAALQLAAINICELIDTGNYESADSDTEQMVTGFTGHADLAKRLWETANRYDKIKAFRHSKEVCERIVADCPEDEFTTYAKLQLVKLKVYELIDAGDHSGAESAVLSLTEDFTGHKQLSRRLYEVAQQYLKAGAFVNGKALHSRIAADYPDDKYGLRSAIQVTKLHIYELIDANDMEAADSAVLQMKSDFNGQEMFYHQLDSVAEKYSEVGRIEKAKEICEEIIQGRPNEDEAVVTAKARLKTFEIIDAIESGYEAVAETAIAQLRSEFSDTQQQCVAMLYLTQRLYEKALPLHSDDSARLDCLNKVVSILGSEVVGQIEGNSYKLRAYLTLAHAHRQLGNYISSIEYHNKVLNDYPEYKNCWNSQFMIGRCYEDMLRTGQIPESEADIIRIIYEDLVQKYPHCEASKYAKNWLERYELNMKRIRASK